MKDPQIALSLFIKKINNYNSAVSMIQNSCNSSTAMMIIMLVFLDFKES